VVTFVGWEDFRAGAVLHGLNMDEVAVTVVEGEYVGVAGTRWPENSAGGIGVDLAHVAGSQVV
jgi:hypothetical protein